MIREAEVRRIAAAKRVDPMVIDLDYSLGWVLLGLKNTSSVFYWLIFKGGTCLRKCYFPDYRFSEDLDFTATSILSVAEIKKWIEVSIKWIGEHDGPDFGVQPIKFEVNDDEYGEEAYQARLYYRGPLNWGGSPRSIKLDVTRAEKVLLPTIEKPIFHPYSDEKTFETLHIPCYSLEEVLSEKIRAISGQRRFAISRDLYDIYNLLEANVDLNKVKQILPEKFESKGLDLKKVSLSDIEKRYSEFEHDWNHRLEYLAQNEQKSFEVVWLRVLSLMYEITK